MKSFHHLWAFFVLLAAVVSGGIFHSASAQPPAKSTPEWRLLKLHHVRPDIMAYWLDSGHFPTPPEYRNQSATSLLIVPSAPATPDPALKDETYRIIEVDSKDALLIYSDQELFNHLQQKAGALDKPIPNVAFATRAGAIDQENLNAPHTDTTNARVIQKITGGNTLQPASAQQPETDTIEWRKISVHSIKPTWLAYWLDAAHQPVPEEYHKMEKFFNRYSMKKATESLPKITPSQMDKQLGIKEVRVTEGNQIQPIAGTLFADDAHNLLWLQSTQKQYDTTKAMVVFLDKPIRKVDIDFKMVEIEPNDLPVIGLHPLTGFQYPPPSKDDAIAGDGFDSTLNSLLTTGKAKIVRSSQLSILNNMTDSYSFSTSTPVTLEIKQADNGNEIVNTESDKDHQMFFEKSFFATFTPTINNDGTMTIFMNATVNSQLTHQLPSEDDDTLWIKNLMSKPFNGSVFTIQDNQTFAETGFNSTMLGLDKENHNIVLFIAAHVVG